MPKDFNRDIANDIVKPVTGTDANDTLAGSSTIINGGDGDDHLTGSEFSERFHAGEGDDFIFAGAGDDTIFGNDGNDTAVFTGSLEKAVLTEAKGNSFTIETADGGVDTLKQVEFLQFDDFTYQLGVNNGVFTRSDMASTDEDTPVTIDVLSNDFDFEGDVFEITSFGQVSANGAAISLVDGQFVYDSSNTAAITDLNDGESITDTFTYTVTDAAGNATTETVSVEVSGQSDGVVIDFDSGVNTVSFASGNQMFGTYQEDGFTLEWSSSSSSFPVSSSAQNALIDIDGEDDFVFGTSNSPDGGFYSSSRVNGHLSQDNGENFSISGFDIVGLGGGDSNGQLLINVYDDDRGDIQYARIYDGDDPTWNISGYDDEGNWFSTTADQETVQDTMFNDISWVEFYAYESDWLMGSGGTGNGIGIDNIEIL